MANTIKYNMPSGIPGAISRAGGGVVLDAEPVALSSALPLPFYGLAGQIDTDGNFRAMDPADADIYGFLSRPFPQNATVASGYFGSSALGTPAVPPQTGGEGVVLRSGYMTVKLYGADAAAKNGVVYVQVDGIDADHPKGSVWAADDGSNRIATKWIFQGPADENGNVEISNLGNNK